VITAYPAMRATDVFVASGAVALRRMDSSSRDADSSWSMDRQASSQLPLTVLTSGMAARLDSAGALAVRSHVSAGAYTAWTSGVLVFDAAPLRDVVGN